MRWLAWGAVVFTTLTVACGDDEGSSTGAGGGEAGGTTSSGTTGGTMITTGSGGSADGGGAPGGAAGVGGAGGAGLATVPCAGETCAAGEVCCFDNVTTTQVRCDQPGACDPGQIELSCNHPDDCGPGATCCSAFDGMVQTMACQTSCDANDEFVMCSGPDQAACPMATTCSNAQAGPGYHYCAK